jgi:hypothetical protein
VIGLTTWLQVPSSDDPGATPLSTIKGARSLFLAVESTCAVVLALVYALLVVVLVFGLPLWLRGGLPLWLRVGLPLWLRVAQVELGDELPVGLELLFGLLVGIMSGLLPGTWVPFVIVRSWLALQGQLPWRLMAFLEDCHRLGIFRQVGPVYQFRHASLQDHLAQVPMSQRADPNTDMRRQDVHSSLPALPLAQHGGVRMNCRALASVGGVGP